MCNITSLFILNNAFNPKNNNNQLASTKMYFAVDDYSFEMYGGILNHNTMKYCSFIKDESPIGCQADGLYEYMVKSYDKLKAHNVTVYVNPPFDEKSIRFAIGEVKKILQLLPKVCIQFTVPRWSAEDYEKGGIYYWLV